MILPPDGLTVVAAEPEANVNVWPDAILKMAAAFATLINLPTVKLFPVVSVPADVILIEPKFEEELFVIVEAPVPV